MAQTLPLELIEHITDEFRPDIETLRSSSLISKQWTVPAQQRLFSRVSIFPELVRAVPSTIDFPSSEDCAGYPFPQYVMDGSIDKFRELLEQAPHLADFVQELHLGTLKRRAAHVSYYYNSEEVLDGAFTRASEIVVRFWNLGSMSLSFAEDYDWEKLAFMHESLFHAVGSLRLRYLKIGHVTFPTRSQFIELLGNCVALQVLIIDYVKIGADADSETRQDAVEKLGPRLTELAVHAEPQSLSQIIQAFILPSSPVDVSSLLRLSLWCQYPKERTYQLISPTCSLLCKAQCLQHLRLFTSLAGPLYQYVDPASLQTLYVCDQLSRLSSTLFWLTESLEDGSSSESGLALTELSVDICNTQFYPSENLFTDKTAWAHLGMALEQHARLLRSVVIRSKNVSLSGFRRGSMYRSADARDALGMRWRERVMVRFIQYLTGKEVPYSGSHCEDFYERDYEKPDIDDWLRNWEIKERPEEEN